MKRIGLVGFGRMGQALLPRLVQGGGPVTVWNRSERTKEIAAAGAIPAVSPAAVVENSDIVLSILYDDAAVEAIYLDANGLLSGDCTACTFVEMSTIKPRTVESLSSKVIARGGAFVEAPVSGSTAAARAGTLLVLAGGTPELVRSVTPVLNLFARRVARMGPIGTAMAAKLGIQLITYSYWLTLGEAIAIASSAGVDARHFLEVVSDTPAALGALKGKFPAILGDDNEIAFSVAAAQKDLEVILNHERMSKVMGPISEVTLEKYAAAARSGVGDDDIAAIVDFTNRQCRNAQSL